MITRKKGDSHVAHITVITFYPTWVPPNLSTLVGFRAITTPLFASGPLASLSRPSSRLTARQVRRFPAHMSESCKLSLSNRGSHILRSTLVKSTA